MTALRPVLMLLFSLVAATAWSQELGRDYVKLTMPQTPDSGEKVEVLEFFSFGCSHCAEMFSPLAEWEKKLPANAVLVKVPISLGRREWGQLVRAYYALEAMGQLERLEGAIYDAIHKERIPLYSEDQIAQWAAGKGVNEQQFRQEFNSFSVSTKASRAEQLARNYRVSGTPQLVVDGKYLVQGKTHSQQLEIARQLIDKAAAERKSGG